MTTQAKSFLLKRSQINGEKTKTKKRENTRHITKQKFIRARISKREKTLLNAVMLSSTITTTSKASSSFLVQNGFATNRKASSSSRRCPPGLARKMITNNNTIKAMASSSSSSSSSSSNESNDENNETNAFRLSGIALLPISLTNLFNTPETLTTFLDFKDAEQFPDFTTVETLTHWSNLFGSDAFSLITLCSCYVLADAAENNRLNSQTYQRLAVGNVLVLASVIGALALTQVVGEAPRPNASAIVTFTGLSLPCLFASVGAINTHGGGFAGVSDLFAKDWDDLKDFSNKDASYLSRYYKLSFFTTLIVGGAFAFSPTSPLSAINEPYASAEFIRRLFGLGAVFGLAPAQFVLLDASKRNRLGGGTFKKLNLSIAASIFLIDFMTVWGFGKIAEIATPDQIQVLNEASATGGISQIYNYVGAISVSLAIAGVYLYQGLFAKK